MANTNDTYEKVNWGWLFDYNGYKFAPTTFVNQLYNNDGTTFMEKYQDDLHAINTKLSSESFVQNARYLVNSSGSKFTVGSANQPVYFSEGIPRVCSNLSASNMTLTNATISNTLTVKNITISSGGTIAGNLNGNAASATKLSSAKTITIGNTSQSSRSFDGSADISWTHAQIGATVSNSWENGTTSGPKLTIAVNGVSSVATIPRATSSQSGIITTGEQTISGVKTFNNRLIISNLVTGGDTTESDNEHYHLVLRNESLVRGTSPTSTCNTRIIFADGAGKSYGGIMNKITSSNQNRIALTGYQPTADRDGNTAYAQIYLEVENDGSCVAGVRNGSGLRGDAATNSSGGQANSIVFMGAAWNDYAEYRNQVEDIEPGYCVASTNDGKVYKTTEKYQPCDGIVSDTYGFVIGKTEQCKTPLAVSGRVLAYFNGNREDYNAGDTVCAGPDGKICKMTREEIKEYPDRIIGIVSEIPEYEEWNSRKVNNRIWIKVK